MRFSTYTHTIDDYDADDGDEDDASDDDDDSNDSNLLYHSLAEQTGFLMNSTSKWLVPRSSVNVNALLCFAVQWVDLGEEQVKGEVRKGD